MDVGRLTSPDGRRRRSSRPLPCQAGRRRRLSALVEHHGRSAFGLAFRLTGNARGRGGSGAGELSAGPSPACTVRSQVQFRHLAAPHRRQLLDGRRCAPARAAGIATTSARSRTWPSRSGQRAVARAAGAQRRDRAARRGVARRAERRRNAPPSRCATARAGASRRSARRSACSPARPSTRCSGRSGSCARRWSRCANKPYGEKREPLHGRRSRPSPLRGPRGLRRMSGRT